MDDSERNQFLKPYKVFFEKFAEVCLTSYCELLDSKTKTFTSKVFNDPVWHSISLYPIEIVLLDSPLLQRLRRIRQLGVAHLIYPGAGHSRFEHTVGVIHQVGQLVASINNSPDCRDCIEEQSTRLLRLAALCHDVGHGVMSHVAENALDNDHECQSLKLAFADELKVEETKISEIAAYYIVGSPSFNQLLNHAKRLSDNNLPANAAECIQKIITGQSFFDKIPLLQEIVTGPFDADKLDYMTRDAFMAGVPVVVDIPRLIQKVRAV
jgi:deoxynucleoside triphosphate triphosphohydrolase SAMHD1